MGISIHNIEITLLVLVVLVALLAVFARRLKVPYPIILVLGGLALGFIPWVPDVRLSPTVVFLVILPPLIFASALNTPWREFKFNIISISMLGLGLVIFTVVGVAVFAHLVIPGFDWRTGAVLGALISPTDIIAVSAIAKRVGLPHSVLQVIDGESLINDAAGLLALQFTTALVVSGSVPSLSQGFGQLVWLIVGGVAVGILIAFLVTRFDRLLIGRFSAGTDLQMLVSLATPYFAYLLGEAIGASGVLATVACGLYVGRSLSETVSSRARLDTRVVWNTVDFALNGFVFIIIGLQLPSILSGISRNGTIPLDWPRMIGEALLVCAIVIVLRYLWILPGARIAHFLRTRLQKQKIRTTSKRELVVMGWSGIRGVLTLAAALSVPFVTDTGTHFPNREAIIFLAYAVILVTLVGQGLTLPALIRRLGISEPKSEQDEEREARKTMLQFVIQTLRGMDTSEDEIATQAVDQLIRVYDQRLQGISSTSEKQVEAQLDRKYREVARRLRTAQRRELNRLRNQGRFREATLRRLERELDLMELRWGD
ncbi:MAG TPA: Na+/H+ antiporter [Acidobacteriaceae bacterium]|jgi:CPA1 family monovalent cation:H+ antiporter|nr:Na+/H+ antiporter [Acidobacteriaceae bacterium]